MAQPRRRPNYSRSRTMLKRPGRPKHGPLLQTRDRGGKLRSGYGMTPHLRKVLGDKPRTKNKPRRDTPKALRRG